MHQVLSSFLPPDHLIDIFTRIYIIVLDQKVPALLIDVAASKTDALARRSVIVAVECFEQTDVSNETALCCLVAPAMKYRRSDLG
jgi:hypothetical protein